MLVKTGVFNFIISETTISNFLQHFQKYWYVKKDWTFDTFHKKKKLHHHKKIII